MYITIYRVTEEGGEAVITTTDYYNHRNLNYAPEVDLLSESLPVNEFTVDIITEDTVEIGEMCELYDDLNNL